MADEYDITEEFALTADDGEDNALNFGGDETPPAQFGNEQTVIFGTIGGMQWGDFGGAFYATNGLIVVPKPPLADTVGGAGLLEKAEFKKLQGKKPTVVSGTLNLPLAQAGAGMEETTEDTPGGLVGIGYSDDGCFGIIDGFARIPRPPEPGYFPKGVYNGAQGQKVDWTAMGTGVIPLTGKENPKDGDLRIVAMLIGGYLSLWFQTYNAEKQQWEE